MNVLVTGTAGFIGFYLVQELLDAGHTVYGIDSINHYYDVALKHDRLHACGIDHPVPDKEIVSSLNTNYTFCQLDLCDAEAYMNFLQFVFLQDSSKLMNPITLLCT